MLIAFTGKTALDDRLHGLTNHPNDNSVNIIQKQLIHFVKTHFKLNNELAMKIVNRGYLPSGSGHVHIIILAIRKFSKTSLEEKG